MQTHVIASAALFLTPDIILKIASSPGHSMTYFTNGPGNQLSASMNKPVSSIMIGLHNISYASLAFLLIISITSMDWISVRSQLHDFLIVSRSSGVYHFNSIHRIALASDNLCGLPVQKVRFCIRFIIIFNALFIGIRAKMSICNYQVAPHEWDDSQDKSLPKKEIIIAKFHHPRYYPSHQLWASLIPIFIQRRQIHCRSRESSQFWTQLYFISEHRLMEFSIL